MKLQRGQTLVYVVKIIYADVCVRPGYLLWSQDTFIRGYMTEMCIPNQSWNHLFNGHMGAESRMFGVGNRGNVNIVSSKTVADNNVRAYMVVFLELLNSWNELIIKLQRSTYA